MAIISDMLGGGLGVGYGIIAIIATIFILFIVVKVISAVYFKVKSAKARFREIQEQRELKRKRKEIAEAPKRAAEERTEFILTEEEYSESRKKFELIKNLTLHMGTEGLAQSKVYIKNIRRMIKAQLKLYKKEFRIEKKEIKEEKKREKGLFRWRKMGKIMEEGELKEMKKIGAVMQRLAPAKYAQLLGLVRKEKIEKGEEFKLEEIEKKEEFTEIRDSFIIARLTKELMAILKSQLKGLKEIEKFLKKGKPSLAAREGKELYKLYTKEIENLKILLRDEQVQTALERKEEGLIARTYRFEKEEFALEKQEGLVLMPLEKYIK